MSAIKNKNKNKVKTPDVSDARSRHVTTTPTGADTGRADPQWTATMGWTLRRPLPLPSMEKPAAISPQMLQVP